MFTVAALYRFADLAAPEAVADRLRRLCRAEGVTGTLLLAGEGINGTVAGPSAGIDAVLAAIRAVPGLADLRVRLTQSPRAPFARLNVRTKAEIVSLGRAEADPRRQVGTHVAPEAWNALIQAPDVTVIDTRNSYETAIGTFAGAVDPGIESFRDFPAWWAAHREAYAGRRVAMFCTGGIRCEKSTALLKADGVAEVYHLAGGILGYLDTVPEAESLWRGECFVFDARVALDHDLRPGRHGLCHACRGPVSPEDRTHPDFEEGVSCPRCIGWHGAADRARFRERQRQIRLARTRGTAHLGAVAP